MFTSRTCCHLIVYPGNKTSPDLISACISKWTCEGTKVQVVISCRQGRSYRHSSLEIRESNQFSLPIRTSIFVDLLRYGFRRTPDSAVRISVWCCWHPLLVRLPRHDRCRQKSQLVRKLADRVREKILRLLIIFFPEHKVILIYLFIKCFCDISIIIYFSNWSASIEFFPKLN